MNCKFCGDTAQFQFDHDGRQTPVCSPECVKLLIGGDLDELSDQPNINTYFAFPDDPIPTEFTSTGRIRMGTRPNVLGSIMQAFENSGIPIYTGQKIDYASSSIIVVLFVPFNENFVHSGRDITPQKKKKIAEFAYKRAIRAADRYGKIAFHVGVIRFYDDQYSKNEFMDSEKAQMLRLSQNVRYDGRIGVYYVPYHIVDYNLTDPFTKPYGTLDHHELVAIQPNGEIQKAVWSIIDDARLTKLESK